MARPVALSLCNKCAEHLLKKEKNLLLQLLIAMHLQQICRTLPERDPSVSFLELPSVRQLQLERDANSLDF